MWVDDDDDNIDDVDPVPILRAIYCHYFDNLHLLFKSHYSIIKKVFNKLIINVFFYFINIS